MKNEVNQFNSCRDVCIAGTCGSGTMHKCDTSIPIPSDLDDFASIAAGLGFTCNVGPCWDGISDANGKLKQCQPFTTDTGGVLFS